MGLACSPGMILALLADFPQLFSDLSWAQWDFLFAPVGGCPCDYVILILQGRARNRSQMFLSWPSSWFSAAIVRTLQPWLSSDRNGWPLSPFSLFYSWKPISCFNLILMNRNTELAWRMRKYCIIGSNHTEHKKPFKVIKLLPSPFLYFFSALHWWAVYLCHHNSRSSSRGGNCKPFSARTHAERAELRQTLSFLAAKAF